MLADFHPKGAVGQSMGVYLEEHGIADRATVIIDAKGMVRHASSIGQRDMDKLAEICEQIDKEHGASLPEASAAVGLPTGCVAYVRNNCASSRAVLLARTNLHLDHLEVKNVSESDDVKSELSTLTGKETAPVLVVGGKPLAESAKIVGHLVGNCSLL